MEKYYCFAIVFLMFILRINAQDNRIATFREIRENYEDMTSDDEDAMPFVKKYILKAKNESNLKNLIQGFNDGRQYSHFLHDKHLYSDSAIHAALKSGIDDEISKAYLSKGIIYYFNEKKYKEALDEYLIAFKYSKDSEDKYLKHKIIYHLGAVKSYLGYYKESLEHFENCIDFFEAKTKEEQKTNSLYNMRKAYYNSLHQMSIASRNLGDFRKSDSLVNLGYKLTEHKKAFRLEKSYFLKCRGILKFNKQQYNEALDDLNNSLSGLSERNDFAWLAVVYLYIGKIKKIQNKYDQAAVNFIKIDSIFKKHNFILPEVSGNYEFLIDYYHDRNEKSAELYYTTELSKIKNLIANEFPAISSKVYREYDSETFRDKIKNLKHSDETKTKIVLVVVIVLITSICFFIFKVQKHRQIKLRYLALQERILKSKTQENKKSGSIEETKKQVIAPELAEQILLKLEKFESKHLYTQKGLTQRILAENLGTNSNYLSILINEHKHANFNKYISELRINYITNLLNTNTKFLRYKMEALANECGISGRQNFSKIFFEINGIRPSDFISNKIKDLEAK